MKKIVVFLSIIIGLSHAAYAQGSSILVNENTQIQKQHGFQQSLFIHENLYVNPFNDFQIIVEKDGEDILGYRVGGKKFDENHFLFISHDDSDTIKTLASWSEVQAGIYKKTILQESTYELIDGIYTPRQNVAATNYYRGVYNHDTTPPVCEKVIISDDAAGIKKINVGEKVWFDSQKYASFLCQDLESGCACLPSNPNCTIQNGRVFSLPESLSHNTPIQADIENNAGLSAQCDSSQDVNIFYDTLSPDVNISVNDSPIDTTHSREYVVNQGVLYDGQQLSSKRFYNLTNTISLKANNATKMSFDLIDFYDPLRTNEGVSGIASYDLIASKKDDGLWLEIGKMSSMFDAYNPDGTQLVNDTQTIVGEDIPFLKNAFTQIGSYQIYISFLDAAGNQARILMYFDIVPDDVDGNQSYIQSNSKNTIYADDIGYYEYDIYLRDRYDNPIKGKEVYNFFHSCNGVIGCTLIHQNMLGNAPSGEIATHIFDESLVSDDEGKISFKIKSFAPGVLTESFSFEMFSWDDNFENIFGSISQTHIFGGENNFLSLFSGDMSAYHNNIWGNDIPISQETLFRLELRENTPRAFDGNISDFRRFIQSHDVDESSLTLTGGLDFNSDGNIYFSGSIDTSLQVNEYHKIGIQIMDSQISPVEISYVISGRQVRHYLSQSNMGKSPIVLMKQIDILSNPVLIIGNLQGVGNSQNSFERQNISEISSSAMRNALRKNIGLSIRSRQHGSTMGGVKYIDASGLANNLYTIESNPSFETLVVRNGNVHIDSDITTSGNMIGIISYIDSGYNVSQGYDSIGNVYIDKDVSRIQAAIYADGALISTENGSPIVGDMSSRADTLNKQLLIEGSLFARNTLGGATLHNGGYILPGGESTHSESLAVQYDLHHIRRGSTDCVQISGVCPYNEYLIIEYDPRINTNPPVLFLN